MKVYKVLRWAVLIVLVVILGLLLKPPDRLVTRQQSAAVLVKNASAFQSKLGELQEAHQQGQEGTEARLTSDEVGAALMAANSPTLAAQSVTPVANGSTSSATEITPEQLSMKDPQVIFEGDEVKGQFSAQVYGKDMFVTLAGHLGTKDGYVTFIPTSFKIGSMPVPVSLVQAQLDKKFTEPETREKLKLPDFVSDLKIENGQLVVVEK